MMRMTKMGMAVTMVTMTKRGTLKSTRMRRMR